MMQGKQIQLKKLNLSSTSMHFFQCCVEIEEDRKYDVSKVGSRESSKNQITQGKVRFFIKVAYRSSMIAWCNMMMMKEKKIKLKKFSFIQYIDAFLFQYFIEIVEIVEKTYNRR